MTRAISIAALMFALLPSGPVHAYDVLGHEWGGSSIKWYLHPSGSSDVSISQLEGALKAAFSEFQKISCFNKTFNYGGKKSSNPKDGVYVQFKENSWDPTVGDAAAYAQTWTGWGNTAKYSVIVFNGKDLSWTTTEAGDFFSLKTDIQGVATHELGHCLGLAHSRLREATMFFSGGSEELRTLDQDDKNGICYIYGSFSQGQPCDACNSDNNCANGYCLGYDEGSYCGKNCTSDSSCAENYYCYDMSGGTDQCVATNGHCGQTGANIPVGYFCYGSETCEDGMCVALPDDAYCSQDCTKDSQCPGWMKCIADLCLVGGSTPVGGNCTSHTDCSSGMCLGISDSAAICTLSCVESSDCPSDFVCSMGYCMEGGSKVYGDECSYDMECKSGECFSLGAGLKICSQACNSSGNCPANDPCTYGICVPAGDGPFGTKCDFHSDCVSGFCAGMSSKFCSSFCDDAGDCPDKAACGSGSYCVPQQDPSDLCYDDGDCPGSEICDQPAADQAGSCLPTCNPYADMGCDDWYDCAWHFVDWKDSIIGLCQDTNGGGDEGDVCESNDNPCRPNLFCANVGGTGKRCYRDCDATKNFGCASYEACLSLGINSDPHHGVCVCDDPTCFEEPAELDIVTPTPDIVLWQDTTSEPELPGVTPVDNEKPVPVVEEKGGDGGCTATGRSTATPGLLLLALFCALAVLRYRWVW
jgi:hypothetical protein